MLNWISSACIVLAGQAGPLYVNTTISMFNPRLGLSPLSKECQLYGSDDKILLKNKSLRRSVNVGEHS